MRCVLCGRTEDDVAEKSLAIAAQINDALRIIENQAEIDILLQRKKKLDKITFTPVAFSDEALGILEKYSDREKSNADTQQLICMHCKSLIDSMSFKGDRS